jgi:outer membrane protein OmpA-like peptidoglycan-associated protein
VKVLASIRDYFEFMPDSTNPDKVDLYRILKKIEQMKPLRGPGDGGKTTLERKGAEGDQPEVLSVRRGPQAVVGSRVIFEAGSERLTPAAAKILDQIVLLIKGHRNVMLVKGHASVDDLPENAEPQQKLNLSIRRAQAVADYLVSHGVEPDILRVIGCSTFEPVMQRAYTSDNRQLNRRVELEATTTLVADFQGNGAATSRPSEGTSRVAPVKP